MESRFFIIVQHSKKKSEVKFLAYDKTKYIK